MRPNFFEQVYRIVKQIPRGKVASYGQIAATLGHPRAARTVGWALSSLPAGRSSDVPWQRVINGVGRISLSRADFSADLQRAMLEDEGVVFDETGHVDMYRFGWIGLGQFDVEELLEQDG